jgi:hypothetical protein
VPARPSGKSIAVTGKSVCKRRKLDDEQLNVQVRSREKEQKNRVEILIFVKFRICFKYIIQGDYKKSKHFQKYPVTNHYFKMQSKLIGKKNSLRLILLNL